MDRDRDRDRQTETERERKRDRVRDRGRDREKDRERDRERERQRQRQNFYQLEDIAPEIDLWFHLWEGKQVTDEKLKEKDIEIIDLLIGADVFYRTIRQALLILSTIPRTTASAARSFSSLRRVKNWLRSTMGGERLTGLCLLSVHRGLVTAKREQLVTRFK
nr:unnamed protein product [Callosobruchus analis]